MVVPPNHPFYFWNFHYKPENFGVPLFMDTSHIGFDPSPYLPQVQPYVFYYIPSGKLT